MYPPSASTQPPLKKFIDFREIEGDISLLFHLFMHSLVDSCMCLDGGLNPQPWQVEPATLVCPDVALIH